MSASASDAHPFPIYNARYRFVAPLFDADGDLVTGATTPDSEVSQDQGTFADATNEMTEIATTSGMYYLDLIATEMDTQCTAVIMKSATAGMKTTPVVLYPVRLPVIRTGTAQAGAASTITLDSGASAIDDYYNGCYVNITNNSPANVLGQARKITDYVGSTKVATVQGTYGTNPSSASTFEVLATPDWIQRFSDVNAFGGTASTQAAGRPEVNTTHVGGTAQTAGDIMADTNDIQTRLPAALVSGRMDSSVGAMAASVVTAAAVATGAIDADAIAADAITAAKIAAGAIDAATFAAGAIDAAAIATGAIDADALAAGTITAAKFAAGAIDAAAIATGAIDADALAADAATEIRSLASGTSDSGTTTTMVDAARTEADTDYWKGSLIAFTSGTLLGQVRLITAFTPATDTITFAPATTVAVGTHTYEILPAGRADIHFVLGTLINALISGRVDANTQVVGTGAVVAGSFAAGAIDAAAIAADAIGASEIGTGAIDADAIAANAITAAKIATDAIGAAQLAADAVDEIWDEAMVELSQAAPSAAPTMRALLALLYMTARNAITVTSSSKTFSNDAGTVVFKKALTDDGTTYTEAEAASGP